MTDESVELMADLLTECSRIEKLRDELAGLGKPKLASAAAQMIYIIEDLDFEVRRLSGEKPRPDIVEAFRQARQHLIDSGVVIDSRAILAEDDEH